MKTPHTLRQFVLLTLFVTCLSTAGCNVLGAFLGKLAPPRAVEAKYRPQKVPMLVIVENYQNPSLNEVDSQRLTYRISEQIEANRVAPVIHPDKLYQLRDKDRLAFGKMTIPQIGKSLQARQVLYVNVRDLTVDTDSSGHMIRTVASVAARIVDVETGRTLWPPDVSEGYPVGVSRDFSIPDRDIDERTVREPVYASLSDQIAKLFYKWRPEH